MTTPRDPEPTQGGNARASLEQILRMCGGAAVVKGAKIEAKMRSGTTDRWKLVGKDLYELVESR